MPILMMPELPICFETTQKQMPSWTTCFGSPLDPLAAKGFVLGCWGENGWRNFATTGPASTPEQLAAVKMRAQESPVHLGMYEKLGVQAVAKPVSEVLPALNTGIVDGFDNTPLFSIAAGWIEPVSHYTLSKHIYQPAAIVYSKRFMDSLPADLQRIVLGDPMAESRKGRVGVRALGPSSSRASERWENGDRAQAEQQEPCSCHPRRPQRIRRDPQRFTAGVRRSQSKAQEHAVDLSGPQTRMAL